MWDNVNDHERLPKLSRGHIEWKRLTEVCLSTGISIVIIFGLNILIFQRNFKIIILGTFL